MLSIILFETHFPLGVPADRSRISGTTQPRISPPGCRYTIPGKKTCVQVQQCAPPAHVDCHRLCGRLRPLTLPRLRAVPKRTPSRQLVTSHYWGGVCFFVADFTRLSTGTVRILMPRRTASVGLRHRSAHRFCCTQPRARTSSPWYWDSSRLWGSSIRAGYRSWVPILVTCYRLGDSRVPRRD